MNRQPPVVAVLVALFVAAGGVANRAGAEEARSVMERSESRTKARTEHTTYTMELLDAAGEVEQTRTLEVFYKRYPDREVTLQKFLSPPVLEDTGMMIVDSGNPSNDIWLYLPATRRLRRISGAEKSNWYLGTQFTYEDFEDYNLDAYGFTLRQEAACGDGQRCWVIEAVATSEAEKQATGYGKKVYWIEKESLYPVRVDYLDPEGKEVKRLTASGLGEIEGYWRPAEIVMRDLLNNRRTRIRAEEREIDPDLDDYFLSRRHLRED